MFHAYPYALIIAQYDVIFNGWYNNQVFLASMLYYATWDEKFIVLSGWIDGMGMEIFCHK